MTKTLYLQNPERLPEVAKVGDGSMDLVDWLIKTRGHLIVPQYLSDEFIVNFVGYREGDEPPPAALIKDHGLEVPATGDEPSSTQWALPTPWYTDRSRLIQDLSEAITTLNGDSGLVFFKAKGGGSVPNTVPSSETPLSMCVSTRRRIW